MEARCKSVLELAYVSGYAREAKAVTHPAPRQVLPGSEAIVSRNGDRLIIEPMRKSSLLELLASWGPLDEGFPDVDEKLMPLRDVDL